MKKITLLFVLLSIAAITRAQTSTTPDTTKKWTIHGENTFLVSQSSYKNWSAGGVNAFAGNLILNYDFNYKKDKWSWDNKVILGYGLSKQQDAGWRKNDDRIVLNSLLGKQASKYWLYTFYMNFQSQFTKGYDYTTEPKTLISNIFAPAYLTFGPGFAYKRSDNFRINISPAAARIIFVNDDLLSSKGAFGVTPGNKSLFQFGASLDAYYKVNLVQNISLENILKLYSDYLHKPGDIYTDYTVNLFMKVNKFVTVNAGAQLIYDGKTRIPNEDGSTKIALQVKQILVQA